MPATPARRAATAEEAGATDVHESRHWTLSASTLGELRNILDRVAHMPADSQVRVRTRMGASTEGSLVKRITITDGDDDA